jgi:hypothetical protein
VSALRDALQQPPSLVKLAVWLQAGGPILARTPGAAKVIGDLLVRCGEEASMALRRPVDAAALSESVFDLARRMHAWLHDNTGGAGSGGGGSRSAVGAGAADRGDEASAGAATLQTLLPADEEAERLDAAVAAEDALGVTTAGLSAAGGAAPAVRELSELADAANSAAAAAEALAGAACAIVPMEPADEAAAAAGAALAAADSAGGT